MTTGTFRGGGQCIKLRTPFSSYHLWMKTFRGTAYLVSNCVLPNVPKRLEDDF
jgi:hypothetical protein